MAELASDLATSQHYIQQRTVAEEFLRHLEAGVDTPYPTFALAKRDPAVS